MMEFKDDYEFLSNFYKRKLVYKCVEYHTVEHAYQSEKSTDPTWKLRCRQNIHPGIIKKESKKIDLIPNWNSLRINIMYECLTAKFEDPELRQKLIDTGDILLVEGNWHYDNFWGYCLHRENGKNMLGTLLMRIRDEISFSIPTF